MLRNTIRHRIHSVIKSLARIAPRTTCGRYAGRRFDSPRLEGQLGAHQVPPQPRNPVARDASRVHALLRQLAAAHLICVEIVTGAPFTIHSVHREVALIAFNGTRPSVTLSTTMQCKLTYLYAGHAIQGMRRFRLLFKH
jgi:hypothetical protein